MTSRRSLGRTQIGLLFLGTVLLGASSPTKVPPPPPGSLRVLVLLTSGGKKPTPVSGAVVWIPGSSAPTQATAPAPRIASKDKRFDPRIAAVPAGTTVEFPNFDRIHHNVFSLTQTAAFDLGLYKNGASRAWKFERPGLVRIYCNIHPQMAALLMVVNGALYAQTGGDGVGLVSGIPPGRYGVQVWEEKGGDWSGNVEITSGTTTALNVTLDSTSWRELPHKNKYGKDYPPPDDDDNRY